MRGGSREEYRVGHVRTVAFGIIWRLYIVGRVWDLASLIPWWIIAYSFGGNESHIILFMIRKCAFCWWPLTRRPAVERYDLVGSLDIRDDSQILGGLNFSFSCIELFTFISR